MSGHGIPRVSAQDKSEQSREKEQRKIEQYRSLVDLVNTKARTQLVVRHVAEREFTVEVLGLTSQLLKQNPEYYTIWNHRRRVLEHLFESTTPSSTDASGALDPRQQVILGYLTTDLNFLVPLLRQFPKCYWIWNHRLWLLESTSELLPAIVARQKWQEELGLVGKMLSFDSRNFHGWGYRRLVISELESPKLNTDASSDAEASSIGRSMVEQEFAYTTKMINTNLSNFSAWHNRGKLIPRLLDERKADADARRKLFDEELALIQKALYTDPYDQSLWFYHQFLMSTLEPNVPESAAIILKVTNSDRAEFYEKELETIREMLDGAEDCKWIYQNLLQYAALFLEVDAGTKAVTTSEMRSWMSELKKLDPLREGRWNDLEKTLGL